MSPQRPSQAESSRAEPSKALSGQAKPKVAKPTKPNPSLQWPSQDKPRLRWRWTILHGVGQALSCVNLSEIQDKPRMEATNEKFMRNKEGKIRKKINALSVLYYSHGLPPLFSFFSCSLLLLFLLPSPRSSSYFLLLYGVFFGT